MSLPNELPFDIVILGGGFAGVSCARTLEKKFRRGRRPRVALVSEENYMVFQPLLPEVMGASISPRHVVNPLRLLCQHTQVLRGRVEQINWPARTLTLNAGDFSRNIQVHFEQLVLALGAVVDLSRIPGMPEHAYLMRNAGDAMLLRATILSRLEEASVQWDLPVRQRLLSFVVVGGGYSGVETAGELVDLIAAVRHFYPNIAADDIRVWLVHSGASLLPTLRPRLSAYAARELEERRVRLLLNRWVKAVTASRVSLDDGTTIEANTVISTVGNAPHPLITTLCQDNAFETARGWLLTTRTCQVKGQTHLWAAGDCAALPLAAGGFCPQTAQFALRQGMRMGENIAAAWRGAPVRPFDFTGLGEIASIGHHRAVAEILGVTFSGFLAWWLWRTVYLLKLPRLDRKLRVMLDWTLDLFFPRDINLLSPRYSTVLKEIFLEQGEVLFRPGEPAFSLYILKSGRIEIHDERGLIQTITAGEYFGEQALLGDRTRSFEARAAQPSVLVSIPARTFHQIVRGSGSLARLFKKSAAKYQSREIIEAMTRRLSPDIQSRPAAALMSCRLATLRPTMTVREALRVFREHPHTCYPVVDEDGRPLGVINREEFYQFLKEPTTLPEKRLETCPLASAPLAGPETTAEQIMERLIRTGSSKLLITDAQHHLLGIVTVLDLVTLAREEAQAESPSDALAAVGGKAGGVQHSKLD